MSQKQEPSDYRKSLCNHSIPRDQCRVCELEGELDKVRKALGVSERFPSIALMAVAKVESLRLAEAEVERLKGRLAELTELIRVCEMERQTAQFSGLVTGWEHPNSQRAFDVLVSAALSPAPDKEAKT